MREIKFRVFHEGKMRYFNGMWYCDEYNSLAFRLDKESREPDGGDYSNLGADLEDFSRPMQFTGLKDKNGKEIYEGDVVRWGDHCEWCRENPVRIATVRIDPDIIFDSQVGVFHFGAFSYQDTHEHLEVIGNIYETPDLIPKQERE